LTGVIILFWTVLKHYIFFMRLNWFDCKRANYAVVFSLVNTLRATKLILKLTAITFTKIALP